MNTMFRTSALAIAIVLALNSFASLASAQCGARQVDTTNLNLGLQAQAAPVVVQGGGCATGQCGAASAASTQAFAPAIVPQQSFVAVNTPRVAVNVGVQGVQRAYTPLYVVTTPMAVVESAPQYAYYTTALQNPGGSASASASAGAAASAATSANVGAFGTQVLAVDPSVQVSTVSACGSGGCGRARILGRVLRPRRTVSVSRARSVTFN